MSFFFCQRAFLSCYLLCALALSFSVPYACSLSRKVTFSLLSHMLCLHALSNLLQHFLEHSLAELDCRTFANHYKNNGAYS